ncbi:MAG: methyltransferase domain-containing protein [Actinomycetota bacterium]
MSNEPHDDRYFGGGIESPVDRDELRDAVRSKYRDVALTPDETFHFHTGRPNAERCRYDMAEVDALPGRAVQSFAGVANPFEPAAIPAGAKVVDLGCGAGFDALLAARAAGPDGSVIGVDMTDEMLDEANTNAQLAADAAPATIEFRSGYLEDIPVADGWADVVISNGVINLCPDKPRVFQEIARVLRPGGRLQFADIANGNDVPGEAQREIDLWTG